MTNRPGALAIVGVLAAAASVQAATVPRKAPDFAISLSGGKRLTLDQYKGKVVAVAFILTACPHCQSAVKCLIRDQNEFGPRGFQAVASVVEDMARINLPEFERRFNPPFPVGYNALRPVLDFMQHPPMVGPRMPLIAFIDREGMIRAQYEGHEPFLAADRMDANIREKILELLSQSEPPPHKPAVRKAPRRKKS